MSLFSIRYMSFKRIRRLFFSSLSRILPLQGHVRYKFVKLSGVNVLGPCSIGDNVHFDTVHPELITIHEGVRITAGCYILSHFLDTQAPDLRFVNAEVIIQKKAFLGNGVIICRPVTIGEGAIVGAGSVVTKDIPPYQIWAGNPAKFIKNRVLEK